MGHEVEGKDQPCRRGREAEQQWQNGRRPLRGPGRPAHEAQADEVEHDGGLHESVLPKPQRRQDGVGNEQQRDDQGKVP